MKEKGAYIRKDMIIKQAFGPGMARNSIALDSLGAAGSINGVFTSFDANCNNKGSYTMSDNAFLNST